MYIGYWVVGFIRAFIVFGKRKETNNKNILLFYQIVLHMPRYSNLTRSFQHYLQEISLNGLGIWPLLCYENQIPESFSDTRLVPNITNI